MLDGADLPYASYGADGSDKPRRYSYPITNAGYSPLTALKLAISDVGASWRRDSVDERMITELTSWGTLGDTIPSEFAPADERPGRHPQRRALPDTDQDGMPDYWENGTGSNPGVANNNDASPSGSGYTRLEDYLNWLAEPHGIALDEHERRRGPAPVHPRLGRRKSPRSGRSATPPTGRVTLLNGCFARFVPSAGFIGHG